MGSSLETGRSVGSLRKNLSRRWVNLWTLYFASVNSWPHTVQVFRRAMGVVNMSRAERAQTKFDQSRCLIPHHTLNVTTTTYIPTPAILKHSMAHRPPAHQRPKPTPKIPQPGVSNPDTTLDMGSNSPSQSGGTSQRQTRGTTALATKQQRRAVGFVSGGMMESDNG